MPDPVAGAPAVDWAVVDRRRFAAEHEDRAAAAQASLSPALRALRALHFPFLPVPVTPEHAEAWLRRAWDPGPTPPPTGAPADGPTAPSAPADVADDVTALSATELLDAYRRGALSPVEVLDATLARIERVGGPLGAFRTVCAESARAAAAASERRWHRGDAGPLDGIPVAVKDVVCTAGVLTTGGSARFADHVPATTATAVQRILDAGGVLVGKTATPEYAFGDAIPGHLARNPWSADHWCGGSSSGSAVALAARLVPLAVGTDTGGSIRVPSSYCGVSGLKPTAGRVPRDGVMTVSWTLDHTGPMARTAEDLARLLRVMAGAAPDDVASSPRAVPDFPSGLGPDVRGLRIGRPRQWFSDGCHDEVLAATDEAVAALVGAGATVRHVDLPHAELAGAVAWTITVAEFAAVHDADLGDLERPDAGGRTASAVDRLIGGSLVAAADYLRALRARALVQQDFDAVWEEVDVVLTPATPTPALRLTPELDPVFLQGDRAWLEGIARNFLVHNVTGMPALVVPSGISGLGLPLGVQIVGPPFGERRCLRVGHALQAVTGHHRRAPSPIP
jgi:aspartyl-tRNA(Asn)/glutamyl-tRNA(Gln) amidotransferase subunit A